MAGIGKSSHLPGRWTARGAHGSRRKHDAYVPDHASGAVADSAILYRGVFSGSQLERRLRVQVNRAIDDVERVGTGAIVDRPGSRAIHDKLKDESSTHAGCGTG